MRKKTEIISQKQNIYEKSTASTALWMRKKREARNKKYIMRLIKPDGERLLYHRSDIYFIISPTSFRFVLCHKAAHCTWFFTLATTIHIKRLNSSSSSERSECREKLLLLFFFLRSEYGKNSIHFQFHDSSWWVIDFCH